MTLSIYADTPTALDPEEIASRSGIAYGTISRKSSLQAPRRKYDAWNLKSNAAGLTIDEHARHIASMLQPVSSKLSEIGKRQLARLWCEIHADLDPVNLRLDRAFIATINEIGAEVVCDLYFHTSGGFVDGACRACRLPENVAWGERSRYLRGWSAVGEWRAQVLICNAPNEARKYYLPPSGELEEAHVRVDRNLTAIFMPEDESLVLTSDVWACNYETGFTAEDRLEDFLGAVKRHCKSVLASTDVSSGLYISYVEHGDFQSSEDIILSKSLIKRIARWNMSVDLQFRFAPSPHIGSMGECYHCAETVIREPHYLASDDAQTNTAVDR